MTTEIQKKLLIAFLIGMLLMAGMSFCIYKILEEENKTRILILPEEICNASKGDEKNSIIGKRYISRDNSYEVNLTRPTKLSELFGRMENKRYLSLNRVLCTIVTEPFKINVSTGVTDTTVTDTTIEQEFVILTTPDGESLLQMYFKDCIQEEIKD